VNLFSADAPGARATSRLDAPSLDEPRRRERSTRARPILVAMRRATSLPVSICLLGAGLGALVAALVATAPNVGAATRDRRFFSARHGVGVDAPVGWSISQHTGYPSILVLLLHPNGSRISVSAAVTPAADAKALADQNRRALEIQHLTITKVSAGARGGVQVDARNPHGDELRQLYVVRPLPNGTRQALVVTLVAKTPTIAAALPGYDWTVAHLALETPSGTEESTTPDAGAKEAPSHASAVPHAGAGGAPGRPTPTGGAGGP
jgi:hypothetical protein